MLPFVVNSDIIWVISCKLHKDVSFPDFPYNSSNELEQHVLQSIIDIIDSRIDDWEKKFDDIKFMREHF